MRLRIRYLVSCVVASLLSTLVWAAGLVICPRCGQESTPGGGKPCGHCGALLPGTPAAADAEASAPPAVPQPEPADASATALDQEAFEAARLDVGLARAEEAKRPELALAYYENALALLAVANPGALPPEAARIVVEGLQRCRDVLAIASKPCSTCGGTGRRRIRVASLAGTEVSATELQGEGCEVCGGSGRVRATRRVDEARLALLQGRREHDTRQIAADRATLGRARVPPEWPEKLTTRQMVVVRKAAAPPCSDCVGLGAADCRTCGGLGGVPCRAPGCRDGWVERRPANSLGAETAIKQRTKCDACRGTGRGRCTSCGGDGRLTCTSCKGTGLSASCTSCGGQGSVTCRRCQGVGRGSDGTDCQVCRGEGVLLCTGCRGDGCRTR